MTVAQLTSVAVENRVHGVTFSMSTATIAVIRWPIFIGSGSVDSITLSDHMFYRNATSIVNAPNAMTIVDMAIENGITSAPVRKGGSRTWVLNPGDYDNTGTTRCDAFLPSALGLSSFPQGEGLFLKFRVSFATTGLSMIASARLTSQVSGSQSLAYDPAATTLVNGTDTVGVFTTSGTAPTSRSFAYCPMVLGNFSGALAPKVLFFSGDSIFEGVGDGSFTRGGGGMAQRCAYNNGTNMLASINMAKASSTGAGANTATSNLVFYYAQFCNIGFDECGTNDFGASGGGGISAATMIGRTQTASTLMKASGNILKTIRTKLICSTTSTDSWATDANQTIQPTWGAGEAVDQFNGLTTGLIPAYYDYVAPITSLRSTGNSYKWINDGVTANFITTDGIHPKANGAASAGTELRTIVDAINLYPPAAGTGSQGAYPNPPVDITSIYGSGAGLPANGSPIVIPPSVAAAFLPNRQTDDNTAVNSMVAVTPSDTVDIPTTMAIVVGSTGNLVYDTPSGQTITLPISTSQVGQILRFRVKRVRTASTTTPIWACY